MVERAAQMRGVKCFTYKETPKHLSHDHRNPGYDLNLASPKCKAQVLTTELQ
jgi:hypothetical protein